MAQNQCLNDAGWELSSYNYNAFQNVRINRSSSGENYEQSSSNSYTMYLPA